MRTLLMTALAALTSPALATPACPLSTVKGTYAFEGEYTARGGDVRCTMIGYITFDGKGTSSQSGTTTRELSLKCNVSDSVRLAQTLTGTYTFDRSSCTATVVSTESGSKTRGVFAGSGNTFLGMQVSENADDPTSTFALRGYKQ